MTNSIHLLSDAVANQIAAGEVIQRPASVVKELVENAVDADADKIQIIVRDAGKTLVQVIDNGSGMSETDARMAFERHATSKINTAADLFEIRTKGFRGEALASIAAVAEVELKSRHADDKVGTKIRMSASKTESQEATACPQGSNFAVKNLFFNIPARRKFLKSDQTELKHIITEVQRVALTHPEIHFVLTHNDHDVFNLGKGNVKQRIVGIFGRHMENNLIDIRVNTDLVKIRGYIGKPEKAKKSSGEQFFFVNRRYMRHGWFYRAVMDAYDRLLPEGAYPSYFIYFDIDPEKIDVNIHPTKTEIKFTEERPVYQMLHAAVKEALGKFNLVPSLDFDQDETINMHLDKTTGVKPPNVSVDPDYNPFEEDKKSGQQYNPQTSSREKANMRNWERLYPNQPDSQQPESAHSGQNPEEGDKSDASFFQLKQRYIITSVKSGLMLIDQVRAQERVQYETYLQTLQTRQGITQKELYPKTIEMPPQDSALIMELMEKLTSLGFDLSIFGDNNFVVNGMPSDLSPADPKEVLEEMVENYKHHAGDLKLALDERIAFAMARTSARRFVRKLEPLEMKDLFYRLMSCSAHNYTPSGKPIIQIITMEELEKRFK
ncbi:MAG TPA: DNA mismatch repair endonuclease MutL [Bacteroidales bacterium]|nr:DNA mismatch repair endonuclease MutL [Bacteroidales bacterium]